MDNLILRVEKWLEQQEELFGPYYFSDETSPPLTNALPEVSVSTTQASDMREELADITDLEALRNWCKQQEFLKTDLADTQLVFGIGNPQADLMLIGEAPGEQEDLRGEPFVGKAGQLLTKILEAIHFSREDVYIANILKHRPPNNRDPLPEERLRSLPVLIRQIELINPKIILCLGRISAQTLLNTQATMKELRGRFHPWHDHYELAVTYHPAALLRNPNWKRDTWEDVQMVRARYDALDGQPKGF
jgi:DNA polymerase